MEAVYPRVGGATTISLISEWIRKGLSPRGRGNQARRGAFPGRQGSIPPAQGETPGRIVPVTATTPRHP